MSLFTIVVPLFIGGLVFPFLTYTDLSRGKALLAYLATVVACGVHVFVRIKNAQRVIGFDQDDLILSSLAASACIIFATAFALRLWGRWVGEKATAEERQPGMTGVRAWFSAANVFVGAAIALFAWFAFDISPLLSAVVIGGLLAAYPLLRMESAAVSTAPAPEDLSVEREKIVSMLEAGKLTPEESAELLQALSQTSRTQPRQIPLTSGQRLMLIGAALVAIGFFLPWFVVNPGKEASRMMNQMQLSVGSPFGGGLELPRGVPFSNAQIKTATMTISGGDIQRGLGWAALALALIAALIPYVTTSLDAATARTVRLLCLGVGGIILLYLLTQNIRLVGVGLIIAVAGYALEIAGVFRERDVRSA